MVVNFKVSYFVDEKLHFNKMYFIFIYYKYLMSAKNFLEMI